MALRFIPRSPTPLATRLALLTFLGATSALAADEPLPLDGANAAITLARELIDKAPTGNAESEQHRKKASELLVRAQGELIKAKAKAKDAP